MMETPMGNRPKHMRRFQGTGKRHGVSPAACEETVRVMVVKVGEPRRCETCCSVVQAGRGRCPRCGGKI